MMSEGQFVQATGPFNPEEWLPQLVIDRWLSNRLFDKLKSRTIEEYWKDFGKKFSFIGDSQMVHRDGELHI